MLRAEGGSKAGGFQKQMRAGWQELEGVAVRAEVSGPQAMWGLTGHDRNLDFILTGVEGLKQRSEAILVMENWLWWGLSGIQETR